MVTTKFYLDARRANGATYSLRINITYRRKIASFPLGIQLTSEQWDVPTATIQNHPEAKFLNTLINRRKSEVDTLILKLEEFEKERLADMSAIQIRDYVVSKLNPDEEQPKPKEDPNTFLKWFDRFMGRKQGRTKSIYEATRRRLVAWIGEEKLAKVKFEDIKVAWLEEFEDFLSLTAGVNANAIHFRNIRTVVNYAIDNEVTTYYAFRRFKIKSEATRKRNFDINTLRRIFTHQCEEEWQQKYLDFFKLSFMLIGINVVDLCGLKKMSQGRVEYLRAKTHRPYSIKVEKEAREIIDRYAGTDSLVNFAENYANYRHFYNNLCKGLNEVKKQLGLEELTTYWARHSWATIAHKLKISKDVIAQALGHGSHTVTDIYIEEDTQAVDEANRKVLDYVLYGSVLDGANEAKKKRGRPKKEATPEVKKEDKKAVA
ncbi:MAG: site-specific integrase [Muribaculaceae bacterium]|nr:site-specific integrase [Muribaculaceae bacterium]